jgi:hypothetical protein
VVAVVATSAWTIISKGSVGPTSAPTGAANSVIVPPMRWTCIRSADPIRALSAGSASVCRSGGCCQPQTQLRDHGRPMQYAGHLLVLRVHALIPVHLPLIKM